jgi:hypothetical protein
MHYHRLVAPVLMVNAWLLAGHLSRGDWHIADGSALAGLADLIVVNFAIAVLMRQQHVLNAIFAAAGRRELQRWTTSGDPPRAWWGPGFVPQSRDRR